MNNEHYIEKTMAGWYVVIHETYDDPPLLIGPFLHRETADQELKEYIQCLPTPRISSAGLSSRS